MSPWERKVRNYYGRNPNIELFIDRGRKLIAQYPITRAFYQLTDDKEIRENVIDSRNNIENLQRSLCQLSGVHRRYIMNELEDWHVSEGAYCLEELAQLETDIETLRHRFDKIIKIQRGKPASTRRGYLTTAPRKVLVLKLWMNFLELFDDDSKRGIRNFKDILTFILPEAGDYYENTDRLYREVIADISDR